MASIPMQNTEIAGFALSPQQRRVLALDVRRAVFPFVAQVRYLLEGQVNETRLEQALKSIIARYEILRTRFADHPGLRTLLQVIMPEGEAEMARQATAVNRDWRGTEFESVFSAPQFDLAAGNLVFATLAHISPKRSVLSLAVPALYLDAASFKIIARELLEAYLDPGLNQELNDRLQYADVAEHLNGLLASDLGLMGRQYWLPQINTARAPLQDAALARIAGPAQFRAQIIHGELSLASLRKIQAALGDEDQFSDELLLLACWQALLRQRSGDGDFILGYAADGRDTAELSDCVGLFEKYLPLGLVASSQQSFRQLCKGLQEALSEARHWQNSFEWPDEEKFHLVCFSYYDASWSFSAEGVQVRCGGLNVCVDRFALKLSCLYTGKAIAVQLGYDPLVYTRAEAEQLLVQYEVLMENAGAAVNLPIDCLEAIGPEERRRLLIDLNALPSLSRGAAGDVVARIQEQAERNPQAVAVRYQGQELAYAELDARANQTANYLKELGVGTEICVALCMERSLEMVVGLLGIMKAGGAFVPLEPTLPTERLAYMLKDSQARLLLTQEHLRARLSGLDIHMVYLDSAWDSIAQYSHFTPQHNAMEENLAYVIYTSGSTGRPKGVALTRRGLSNYVNWACAAYACRPGGRAPVCSSLGFDLTITSLWPLLVSGGCAVLAPEQQGMEWLVRSGEEQFQLVKITPAHLRMLEDLRPDCGAGIADRFVIGGEALRWEELAYWRKTAPESRLINEYGPTETVVGSCIYEVNGESPAEGRVPIGRPIANTQVYVLNPHYGLVPTGAPGELFIGGAGLARGYLGRPDLTADRFVPHPFSASGGERLYRTGDLVRWNADGQLDYLGRLDEQVKLHGYRIELAEIEYVLQQHPRVERSVVILREDHPGDKRLVAYIVQKDRSEPLDSWDVRIYLKQHLPEYMVPSGLVELREIPLTSNGKVNRKALPAPKNNDNVSGVAETPRTITEQLVAGIWEQVLKREGLGRGANFFEQGGHSLMATQVVSRVRNLFQVELPLRTLFEAPTVAALAKEIDRLRTGSKACALPIQPVKRDKDLPLSYAQQRLWFVNKLAPESTAYNIPFGLNLRGNLHQPALQWCLDEMVRRHEVLRTTFPSPQGVPVQKISDSAALQIEEADLRQVPENEREDVSRRLGQEQAGKPFGLAAGPLLRLKLLQFADHEYVLLVTMHHIISDGWSIAVMAKEFAALYELYIKDRDAGCSLPDLKVQYADYSVWQRERLLGPFLEQQLAYWRKQLEGAPEVLALPADRPRPARATYAGARERITIPSNLNVALRQLSRIEGSTLFMVLLTAFQSLLGRYSDQIDVVVGTTIAGRTSAETEPLIGMFVNMLALRSDLSGNLSYRQLLGQVRETLLGAYAHQEVPFERLVSELQLERNLGHSPIFQVTLELQNTPQEVMTLPGLQIERMSIPTGTSKFDLTLSLNDTSGEMSGIIDYNPDLFDSATVQRFIGHYRNFLKAIASQPDMKLSEVPFLSPDEREQLLFTWNDTSRAHPQEQCMHHLFEAQAESVPEKVAVIYEERELTYGELEQRANALAHYLAKLGVGPEVRVGICMERGPEMAVGLLGILKAGGAYVPLDPSHPAERLSYMLADSRASVVLTQQHLLSRPFPTGFPTLCLDKQWDLIAVGATAQLRRAIPDNLAYIYYTSGSTGKPKGVAITHRAIVNYIRWAVQAYNAMKGNGAPVHSSIAVDMTLSSFLPLFAGSSIKFMPAGPGMEGLLHLLKGRPEWALVKLTPTHLTVLNSELSSAEMAQAARALVIGGDNLLAESILPWRKNAPHVLLVNEYGPTETVVGCCTYSVSACSSRQGSVPIGKPIENMRMYVLDRYGQPVPIGVFGELYIGGTGVARGYFERPGLTAEKFVPDEFSGEKGGRLYRTGDQARFLPDGNLEYLGRLDHQVKIRGFRIELGEIEAALSSLPGIDTALVMVREDAPGEKRLVAYVVARESIDFTEVLRQLKERLPDYMVPVAFLQMERLPLSASGKIDRKALPAPEIVIDEGKYRSPRTALERILCGIWEDLLGVPQVGIHDNFFQLGGDSILCIQVIARAREEGIQLTARQMFERQTIAELSEVAGTVNAELRAAEGAVTGDAPLTPIQAAFFAWKLAHPQHFNHAVLLQLTSGVDTHLLEQAVNALLAHHDVLRTRFESVEGEWRQSYEEVIQPVYERHDLSQLEENEQLAVLEQHAESVQGSLDLYGPQLVKAVEYELGGKRGRRLLLAIHHLLVDGVSWRILLEDMEHGYEQLKRGKPVLLPRKTTSYKAWAEHLRAYGADESLKQELEYWCRSQYLQAGKWPLDYALSLDEANLWSTKRSVTASLDEEQTRALLELPGAEQGDVDSMLMTALARACTVWCGSAAVLVNLEAHGREELFADVDVSRTVGWFTSLYPVLLDTMPAGPWKPDRWLKSIQEQLRSAPNRGIGYGVLRYLAEDEEIRQRLEDMPQPQISFNYLGQFDQVFRRSKLFAPAQESSGKTIAGGNRRQHILDVQAIVVEGKLRVSWSYSNALHRAETMEKIAASFMEALRELLTADHQHGAAEFSPADFPLTRLTHDDLLHVASLLDE